MKKRSLIFVAGLFMSSVVVGQTNTRFSQFNVAKALINPGAIGTEAQVSAEMIYRNQWTGQPGSPNTFGFVGAYEITPSHAVGLAFMNDQVGIAKSNEINLGYSYRVNFNDEQFLSFGATVGMLNMNNDYSRLFLINPNDPAFAQSLNTWKFNAGFGVYYNGPKMYAGYSIPSLMSHIPVGNNAGFKSNLWHHHLMAGFYFSNRDGSFLFNPCVQVKFVPNAPIQGDLVLRNIIRGQFAIVVGYRSENALIAGFDFMVGNKARFGYNFNYNLNRFAGFSGTSHELYLGLGLPFYYETNRFLTRKYLNKKNQFSREYQRRANKYNKRR